jgi:hypothetical protein
MADDFEHINFGGRWNEDDWERFFEAQDRLSYDRRRVGAPPERPGLDPSLSFRRVLRSFGMDPDNPESLLARFRSTKPWALMAPEAFRFGIRGPIRNGCLSFWRRESFPEK